MAHSDAYEIDVSALGHGVSVAWQSVITDEQQQVGNKFVSKFKRNALSRHVNSCFVAAVLSFIIAGQLVAYLAAWLNHARNVNAIVESRVECNIKPNRVVRRQAAEPTLQRWLNDDSDPTALIVYGLSGSGKSIFVRNLLAERAGVIEVVVTRSIACALASRVSRSLSCKSNALGDLKQVFADAKAKLGGAMPIVVANVDADANQTVVERVLREAKYLWNDNAMVRCIVVMTDISFVFALGDDWPRRTPLYIDWFTVDEANQFVDLHQLQWNASFRAHVFSQFGRLPIVLASVKRDFEGNHPLDEFLDQIRSFAHDTLAMVWRERASASTRALLHRIAVANGTPVPLDIEPLELIRLSRWGRQLVVFNGDDVRARNPQQLKVIQQWAGWN